MNWFEKENNEKINKFYVFCKNKSYSSADSLDQSPPAFPAICLTAAASSFVTCSRNGNDETWIFINCVHVRRHYGCFVTKVLKFQISYRTQKFKCDEKWCRDRTGFSMFAKSNNSKHQNVDSVSFETANRFRKIENRFQGRNQLNQNAFDIISTTCFESSPVFV